MDLIPFSSRRLQGEEDCEKAERVTLCNKLLVPETPSPVGPVCVREMDTCCDLSPTLSASSDWAGCGPRRDAGPQCQGASQPRTGSSEWYHPNSSLVDSRSCVPGACLALHSHLRHGLRKVSGDGSEAFSAAVHDAAATATHGWARTGREGAGRCSRSLPLACQDRRCDVREPRVAAPPPDLLLGGGLLTGAPQGCKDKRTHLGSLELDE